MSSFDVSAYLGPADATAEQKAALVRASDMIAARYPDVDDESEQAMCGAAQVILGDTDLAELAAEYARARRAEREAMARLVGGVIAGSGEMDDSKLSRASGLNRMTIRKALGK